jgi:hypothetical protein
MKLEGIMALIRSPLIRGMDGRPPSATLNFRHAHSGTSIRWAYVCVGDRRVWAQPGRVVASVRAPSTFVVADQIIENEWASARGDVADSQPHGSGLAAWAALISGAEWPLALVQRPVRDELRTRAECGLPWRHFASRQHWNMPALAAS